MVVLSKFTVGLYLILIAYG
jgi:hypothetical protein